MVKFLKGFWFKEDFAFPNGMWIVFISCLVPKFIGIPILCIAALITVFGKIIVEVDDEK